MVIVFVPLRLFLFFLSHCFCLCFCFFSGFFASLLFRSFTFLLLCFCFSLWGCLCLLLLLCSFASAPAFQLFCFCFSVLLNLLPLCCFSAFAFLLLQFRWEIQPSTFDLQPALCKQQSNSIKYTVRKTNGKRDGINITQQNREKAMPTTEQKRLFENERCTSLLLAEVANEWNCSYLAVAAGQYEPGQSHIPQHVRAYHDRSARVPDLINAEQVGLQFWQLGWARQVFLCCGPVSWLQVAGFELGVVLGIILLNFTCYC